MLRLHSVLPLLSLTLSCGGDEPSDPLAEACADAQRCEPDCRADCRASCVVTRYRDECRESQAGVVVIRTCDRVPYETTDRGCVEACGEECARQCARIARVVCE